MIYPRSIDKRCILNCSQRDLNWIEGENCSVNHDISDGFRHTALDDSFGDIFTSEIYHWRKPLKWYLSSKVPPDHTFIKYCDFQVGNNEEARVTVMTCPDPLLGKSLVWSEDDFWFWRSTTRYIRHQSIVLHFGCSCSPPSCLGIIWATFIYQQRKGRESGLTDPWVIHP